MSVKLSSKSTTWTLALFTFLVICITRSTSAQCTKKVCHESCQCPLAIPNEGDVHGNPMTILITGSGKINKAFIDNIESALKHFKNPTGCKPRVTLFIDAKSTNDSQLDAMLKSANNDKMKYRFGIYARSDKDTTEDWRRVIDDNRKRLKDKLDQVTNSDVAVDGFRAKDFLWTNHMFAALDQLDIKEDFSYVTAQPLWPFTFPYGSALCDSKESLQDKGVTRLCPGRFDDLWEIPNNMLFAEYNSELFNCTWLGDCLNLSRSHNQTLADMLITNYRYRSAANSLFHNYWQSREPLVLNMEEDFFEKVSAICTNGSAEEVSKALSKVFALFAEEVNKNVNDSYYVSASQLIQWMRNKQPTFQAINSKFYEGEIFECKTGYSYCEISVISVSLTLMGFSLVLWATFLIPAACLIIMSTCCNYTTSIDMSTKITSTSFKVVLMPIGCFFTKIYEYCKCCKSKSNQNADDKIVQQTGNELSEVNISCRKKITNVFVFLGGLIYAGLQLFNFFPLLYGPIVMCGNVVQDKSEEETIQGYLFFSLVVVQTVTVGLYALSTVFISCWTIFGLTRLKNIIDKLQSAFRKPMPLTKLWVSLLTTAIIGVIIGAHVIILSISYGMKSNVGWYSKFDCDTAWMYASFYALFYLMAVMTVVHAYSSELWAQVAIMLFDVSKRNALISEEDNTEIERLLSTLKSEYSKRYSRKLSPLLLAPVQALFANRLAIHFAMYLQKTFRYTDKMGLCSRISLIFGILITSCIPYVATLLTHRKVNKAYKKHMKRKNLKARTNAEGDNNAEEPAITDDILFYASPQPYFSNAMFTLAALLNLIEVIVNIGLGFVHSN